MRHDLSVQPTDAAAVTSQVNVQRAFQRLSSERRINTGRSATKEIKAQEVDLRSVFDRLAQATEVLKTQKMDRLKLAGQLRELAVNLQQEMGQAQHDSHVVVISQEGLQAASEVLQQMREKIAGAISEAMSHNQEVMDKIRQQLENLSQQLREIHESAQFDNQPLFASDSVAINIGTTTSQAVPLGLPSLLPEDLGLQLPEPLTPEQLPALLGQVEETQEYMQGEQARIDALRERLQLRTHELSTANDGLMAMGLQLRDMPEAVEASESLGYQIRKGHFSSLT